MPVFSATALAGMASAAGAAYTASQNRKAMAATNQASQNLSYEQNVWNALQADKANAFESAEAQKMRDFQEASNAKQMAFQNWSSSTAHQREILDLRAAGLNPILSGTGGMGSAASIGASSAGAMARGHASSGQKAEARPYLQPDFVTPAIGTALSTAKTLADVKVAEANEAEIRARTPTYETQIAKAEQEIRESASRIGLNAALEDKSVQEVNRIYAEIAKLAVEMDLLKVQTAETGSRIGTNRALAGKYGAETAVATETERSMVTDRYLRKRVGDIEQRDLPKPLADIPLDLIKGLLYRFIK